MPTAFCPGYGEAPFRALVEDAPGESVYPKTDFRIEGRRGAPPADLALAGRIVTMSGAFDVEPDGVVGIPAMIPAEMCYMGWQEPPARLAHVVEPEIPDGA